MGTKRATTPEPVAVKTVCSECGLDWALHGDEPTTDDCIRLLKAELARRPVAPVVIQPHAPAVPVPYPLPYPVPCPGRARAPWYGERPPKIICEAPTRYATPRQLSRSVM